MEGKKILEPLYMQDKKILNHSVGESLEAFLSHPVKET